MKFTKLLKFVGERRRRAGGCSLLCVVASDWHYCGANARCGPGNGNWERSKQTERMNCWSLRFSVFVGVGVRTEQ